MAAPALSPELHADLLAKLERLLDQADDLRGAKAALGRTLGAELWKVQSEIATVRAQMKGQDSPQLQVPGTEVGEHRTDPLVVRLLALAGKTRPAPGGTAPAKKPEPLDDLVGSRAEAVKRHQGRAELVRWVADERARKVPNFVVEQTGLKSKSQVIAKYGERAVFEKGKPTPKPAAPRPGAAPPKQLRPGIELCMDCRKPAKRPGGALTTAGYCWNCHLKHHPEHASRPGLKPEDET